MSDRVYMTRATMTAEDRDDADRVTEALGVMVCGEMAIDALHAVLTTIRQRAYDAGYAAAKRG